MVTDNLYNDISMFDAEYYLANNPDVKAAIEAAAEDGITITAQQHYFLHGAAESLNGGVDGYPRAPNPWFDAKFYQDSHVKLKDVAANELLAHFSIYGAFEGLAPNPAYADENGMINPAELLAYVNAPGNEDVKAAVEEMTGQPVGDELTAEQAPLIAYQFFEYGINEDRKGGIADITPEAPGETDSLTEALNEYQEALDTQATALNAEQDVAAAAVDALELDIEADSDTELFDVEDVTGAVDDLVDTREQAIRDATDKDVIGQDEEINADSIALANQILSDLETVAQKQVNTLKSKNPAVVSLQEKIAEYNSAAEEINDTIADFKGQQTRFDTLNEVATVDDGSDLDAADDAEFTVELSNAAFGDDADADTDATITIKFNEKSGKAEITAAINNAGSDVFTDKDALAAFNALKGVDALVASMEAVYGNIAKQESAANAVDSATLNALKKAGYKVYEENTSAANPAKPASWNDVEIKNGEVISKSGTVYYLAALDKDGDELTFGASDTPYGQIKADASTGAATELVGLSGLNATAVAMDTDAAITSGNSDYIDFIADKSDDAVKALQAAKDDVKAFNKAVDEYNEAVDAQSELKDAAADVTAAAEAVAEAEEAFGDLGYNLVTAEDGLAFGEVHDENAEDQDADLFVYGGSKLTVENFDGNDKLYFGDKAANLIDITKAQAESAAGKLGGDANVLDIFAYQDGANTILFVESEAIAGNASGAAADNPDLVEVTLTGVNLADLSFEDGFLAFA